MPKVNQTMLDKLVDAFKSGQRKPEIIQATTIRDPLGYSMVQRRFGTATGKMPSMTPERQMYQRGIEARIAPRHEAAMQKRADAYELRDKYENEWRDAIADAKESMKDDWESGLDYQEFEDVDPGYLEVDAPTTDLREYWPGYARSPEEIGEDFDAATDAYYAARDAERELFTPAYRMREQTMTPRYRNYQRAMRQREDNARVGRLNAAIMNLYRQGYSMPEIREILRRQGR